MARMNRPAPVEVSYKHMRFLITHNPTNATLSTFIEDLKKYGATTVVRVCEVTYDKTPLEKDGITVVEAPWSHQQQAAHLPGEIPAQTEAAVQRATHAQDPVLRHVGQDLGWTWRPRPALLCPAQQGLQALAGPTSPFPPRHLRALVSEERGAPRALCGLWALSPVSATPSGGAGRGSVSPRWVGRPLPAPSHTSQAGLL
nr:protein tyrosine phosphatase type IVA 3 isoform X1 [Pan troglodytes]